MSRGNRNKQSRLFLYSALSLGLHFALMALWVNRQTTDPGSSPKEPAVIELSDLNSVTPQPDSLPLSPKRSFKDQVVETEDAGNTELDPNAALLSNKNQKAEQQTKAASTDGFKTGGGKGEKEANAPSESELQEETASDDELTLGTLPPKKRDWKKLSLKDLSVHGDGTPLSASDDYLPGVASGERTILSTREFRYFSYYNRIKELLRQHWKPNIEREVAKLWGKGQMLREHELVTRVLVLLDQTGQIQKVSKVGASGVQEIDEVAVQAFIQAAPFPNPPAGLIDTDGFVRINWDFILQTASAPTIQYRPGGGNRPLR